MKKLKMAGALGLIFSASMVLSSSAFAYDFLEGDEIFINTSTFGEGQTDVFTDLAAPNLPATSVYTTDGTITQGNEEIDLIGKTFSFSDIGAGIFESLVGLDNTQNAGFQTSWGLDITYNVGGVATFVDGAGGAPDGTLDQYDNSQFPIPGLVPPPDNLIDPLDAIFPIYNTDGSGVFEILFNDKATPGSAFDGTKLIEFTLAQASVGGANVVFYAEGNYDWYTDGASPFVENFFNHVDTGLSFYELWQLNSLDPMTVVLRTDFNVDPNFVPRCPDAACATVERTTDLNITTKTALVVPEPAPLALLGLGLAMFGGMIRRRVKL